MPLSTTVKNKILDSILTISSPMYAGCYLGLSTTAPNPDGTNVTEPSGNGYARVQLGSSNFSSASNGAITNNAYVYMPSNTGAWGKLTHFVLYSTQSGGTFIGYGEIRLGSSPTSITVGTETTVIRFAPNQIVLNIV